MPDLNPSAAQQSLLQQLDKIQTDFTYDWDTVRGGLASAYAHDLDTGHVSATPHGDDENRMVRVTDFLARYGVLFGLPTGMRALRLLRTKRDALGFTHLQFQQHYVAGNDAPAAGVIEVYGSTFAAHFSADGRLVEVQSSCHSDLTPVNTRKIKPEQLGALVLKSIQRLEGFKELSERMKQQEETLFPLMQPPRLVIYPRAERMLFTWATHGYALLPKERQEDPETARDTIAFGQMFFDAETGGLFLFVPTRQDLTSKYRLTNTTGARPIAGAPNQDASISVAASASATPAR